MELKAAGRLVGLQWHDWYWNQISRISRLVLKLLGRTHKLVMELKRVGRLGDFQLHDFHTNLQENQLIGSKLSREHRHIRYENKERRTKLKAIAFWAGCIPLQRPRSARPLRWRGTRFSSRLGGLGGTSLFRFPVFPG